MTSMAFRTYCSWPCAYLAPPCPATASDKLSRKLLRSPVAGHVKRFNASCSEEMLLMIGHAFSSGCSGHQREAEDFISQTRRRSLVRLLLVRKYENETSGRLDVRTSGRWDVRTSERPDVGTSGRPDVGTSDVQTSQRPDDWTVGRPDVKKIFFLGLVRILLGGSAPGSAHRGCTKAVVFTTKNTRFQVQRPPKSIQNPEKIYEDSKLEAQSG